MDGNENPPRPPSPPPATASFAVAALVHPLVSTAFAFYALVLLYFPRLFIRVLLSPVLAITAVSLFALLRLGAAQRARKPVDSASAAAAAGESKVGAGEKGVELGRGSPRAGGRRPEVGFASSTRHQCSFVEWDVKAPLEVIYEEYEGEGDDNDDHGGFIFGGIERYPSLSMCYPDSDSDSDSESSSPGGDSGSGSDSPEKEGFHWETEDGGEGLIEIALDLPGGEEENLIEIDISPASKNGSGRLD